MKIGRLVQFCLCVPLKPRSKAEDWSERGQKLVEALDLVRIVTDVERVAIEQRLVVNIWVVIEVVVLEAEMKKFYFFC